MIQKLLAKKPWRSKWFGAGLVLLATAIYFAPLIAHASTYMDGGDYMFNGYLMERNQNCMLRQHCPVYWDANIYYPHKNTMLYSEVAISPSVVMLPLRAFTDNPILSYNLFTILSYAALGIAMFALAWYLSKGNWYYSLLAGLLFEFGPNLLMSIEHLPNRAVFCVPLAFLAIFKYLDTRRKRYLAGLLAAVLYSFFASWYQMAFMLMTLGFLLIALLYLKRASWQDIVRFGVVVAIACVAVIPLALHYFEFSKLNHATYTLSEKAVNASAVKDYIYAPSQTALGWFMRSVVHYPWGIATTAQTTAYAGFGLFAITFVLGPYLLWRKLRNMREIRRSYVLFGLIGVGAFLLSLGPLLKIGHAAYYPVQSYTAVVPMPALLIHIFVPPLGFLRDWSRIAALLLFAMCCLLALLARAVSNWPPYRRRALLINVIAGLVLAVDMLPFRPVRINQNAYAYNAAPPAVYQYIKDEPTVDNVVVLQAEEYPRVSYWFARTEVVFWAAYAGKNFFNGYSGYEPPTFGKDYGDFVNLDSSDPAKMRAQGLKYVVVDRELYSNKPEVLKTAPDILGKSVYHDGRYDMYKL